jgi:hypothetical protein
MQKAIVAAAPLHCQLLPSWHPTKCPAGCVQMMQWNQINLMLTCLTPFDREQMKDAGLGDVPSQMVDQLEATWSFKFEPGYNSNIQFMGHLWEPLNANFRPLSFYLATEAVGWFARTLLKRWGFEHHKHK